MVAPWIIGSDPSERFPVWTRANVGEVFPDPVSPFTFTVFMREETEGGWRDALVEMGAFTHDEFVPGKMETLGVFGSYCYLNASVTRIIGERAPGLSAQAMDDIFFGAQPGIPPYEPVPGDLNEERTAAIGASFAQALTATRLDQPLQTEKLMNELHTARPDFTGMSNRQLYDYAMGLFKMYFRRVFKEHIATTFLGSVPVGALTQICAAVGRPDDAMRIISGVGDVESAAPSMEMWELGRMVANNPGLTAAFDGGVAGVLGRVEAAGSDGAAFREKFAKFLDRFGCRGPNEWDTRNDTWETKPELALAAIDRMRLAPADAAPGRRNEHLAKERARLVSEISTILAGDPETKGMFEAAAHSAALYQAGRERTKTNAVKLVHEGRMAMKTMGERMVAAGECQEWNDYSFVLEEELEDWLKAPASFNQTISERRALDVEYRALQEPFVFYKAIPDPSTWRTKGADKVDQAKPGDVLVGFPGCPGKVTGTARVVLDPLDPTALGPGDILVAPITDPAWTPLFVAAGGVIVDVGAAQSHAMIVSRELGIPCVPSVTQATRRIPDGAKVLVDGDAGTVTVLAIP